MRMTKQLREVAKSQLLQILSGHPNGLKTVRLYSMQWRSHIGPVPSLRQFLDLLYELRSEGEIEEIAKPGQWIKWKKLP